MTATRPLAEPIVELRRRLGTCKALAASVTVPDLGISAARVPPGAPIEVDLILESISEGVVASGSVTFPWRGDCRRCLQEVTGTATVEIREVFQADPVEGETWPLGTEIVDLEPMVREAVLLALPLAPLCTEGCLGPAPEHFPTGTAGEAAPSGPDPRWAALDELRFE